MRLGRPRNGVIRGGRVLGKIEEYFLEQLTQGDTFRFAGRVLQFEGIRENVAYVSPSDAENPMIPSYEGGKFPLTTYLASQVREILADPQRWASLPTQVCEWLQYQQENSLPARARRSFWSRRFRAATASTWSPTPSRGGSRTRRSACC